MGDADLEKKVKAFESSFFKEMEQGLEQNECAGIMYVLLREQELIPSGPKIGKLVNWLDSGKFQETETLGLNNILLISDMVCKYEVQGKIIKKKGMQNDYYAGSSGNLSCDAHKDVHDYSQLITNIKEYLSNKLPAAEERPIRQDKFEKMLDSYFSENNPFKKIKKIKISKERINNVKDRVKEELVKEYIDSQYVIPNTPLNQEILELI
ncbi:MAG: hypothetical protein U9O94_03000 [Nanoarchaeota archaeon]|nr:hypothetical protein [Nanoarchaeota archaeon]